MPAKTSTTIASYLTPANIQTDIEIAGTFLGGLLSPATKTILVTFANDLLALAQGALTVQAVDQLIADAKLNIPAADAAIVNVILTGALAVLNIAIVKFGSHNVEVIDYAEAIANGILVGFPVTP
jgi:hypothetical protein